MKISSSYLMSDKGLSLLSQLFRSSGEGMIIFNIKGEIQAANPRSEELFGWSEKEMIGQKAELLIPHDFRAGHVAKRHSYVKSPAVRSMGKGIDLHALRKDGSTFPIEISLTYIEHDNEMLIVGFMTDITQRKKQEKELETYAANLESKVRERTRELEHMNMGLQSQIQERKLAEKALKRSLEDVRKAEREILKSLEKEKELSELKSRFVSMASHEFRTPLTTISSSANLIRKYRESEHQPNREKHIDRITNSVKNLTGILNDFLSMEKLESGVIQVNTQKVRLHEILDEIIQELTLILKKNQEIICNKEKDVEFVTDPHLLKNLLYNLVSNASKYSEEGMSIEISCSSADTYVQIEVKDHGIGIPKKEQKNLFERFFRAGNATNIQGTGLGLHIVRKYIDLLKGRIEFESDEGKGSIFRIQLPYSAE